MKDTLPGLQAIPKVQKQARHGFSVAAAGPLMTLARRNGAGARRSGPGTTPWVYASASRSSNDRERSAKQGAAQHVPSNAGTSGRRNTSRTPPVYFKQFPMRADFLILGRQSWRTARMP